MRIPPAIFAALVAIAAVLFVRAPYLIGNAPAEAEMGLVQKIFYFHVPVAMWTLLSGVVCGVASAMFLARRRPTADRIALCAAEIAVVLGIIVFITGPLWAIKAWGVWWDWDARLTTTVVMWMVFVSYLLLRRFGGPGSEVLAAAVGVFGMALVPFVYLSVDWWRTLHPPTSIVPTLPRAMGGPFWWCFAAFTLFYVMLLATATRIEAGRAALERAEMDLED
jgi:heme exporter protein C